MGRHQESSKGRLFDFGEAATPFRPDCAETQLGPYSPAAWICGLL